VLAARPPRPAGIAAAAAAPAAACFGATQLYSELGFGRIVASFININISAAAGKIVANFVDWIVAFPRLCDMMKVKTLYNDNSV
jgi:hypothetical protein